MQTEPSYKFIPMGSLISGETYQWKVRCACSTNPIVVSEYSDYNIFTLDESGMVTENSENKMLSVLDYELNIFPNPNDGNFTITTDMKDYTVEVIDMTGKVIWSKTDNNENQVIIESLNVETGIYSVRIFNDKAVVTEKVMIKD